MQVLAYFLWVVVPVTNLAFRAFGTILLCFISFHGGSLWSMMVLLEGGEMNSFYRRSCMVSQAHGAGELFLGSVPVVAGSPCWC